MNIIWLVFVLLYLCSYSYDITYVLHVTKVARLHYVLKIVLLQNPWPSVVHTCDPCDATHYLQCHEKVASYWCMKCHIVCVLLVLRITDVVQLSLMTRGHIKTKLWIGKSSWGFIVQYWTNKYNECYHVSS